MNPLTHVYIALELFKEQKLTKNERDHLILGSVLPDIHQSGLIHYQKTHYTALNFFHNTKNRLHKFLALGMILHGEEPKGVDYYAHGKNGIIRNNHEQVIKIARKYKKYVGKMNHMTSHHLIEYSADNIIAKKNVHIIPQVLSAFKNRKIDSAISSFSHHFELSEKANGKIIKLLKNKHLLHYLDNFATTETTSRSWVNFTFFMNLKQGKSLPFREKIKKISQFSFYNLKRRIHHKEVTQLFEEINAVMEQPALKFIYETTEKIQPLKEKLYKEIE